MAGVVTSSSSRASSSTPLSSSATLISSSAASSLSSGSSSAAGSKNSTSINTWPVITTTGIQVVPSSSSSTSTSSSSQKNFPIAAIAVVSIVGGIIGIFVAYRVYVWCYRRSNARNTPFPETRPLAPSPGMSNAWPLPGEGMGGGGFERTTSSMAFSEAGWAPEKESPTTTPGSPFYSPPGSASGAHTPTTPDRDESPSRFANNSSRGSLAVLAGAGGGSARDRSSVGSMPRRPFYGNSYTGPQARSPASNRLSGAPHAPHSRIDIVPPLPLAPPPGTVVATDKSTLDFSPLSGIGSNTTEEWFVNPAGSPQRNPAFDGDRAPAASTSSHHGSRSPRGVTPPEPSIPHSFPPALRVRPESSSSSSSSQPPRQRNSQQFASANQYAHGAPTSPLDKLQQRIVQDAHRDAKARQRTERVRLANEESGGGGPFSAASSASGSRSSEGRGRTDDVGPYLPPSEQLEDLISVAPPR